MAEAMIDGTLNADFLSALLAVMFVLQLFTLFIVIGLLWAMTRRK